MPRYAVKRIADGEVLNRIEWCGFAQYDPGEGCTLELDPDPEASPRRNKAARSPDLPPPDKPDDNPSGEDDETGDADPRDEEIKRLTKRLAELEAAKDQIDTRNDLEVGEDGIPNAFRGLMVEGETPERFTERMHRRWHALRQYRIDGAKPLLNQALPKMTDEEIDELSDLEARQQKYKWLVD